MAVLIQCPKAGCPGPVTATYKHVHADGTTKEWTAPAVGPDPHGVPQPQPCPDDAVSCQAESWKCNTCGSAKP